MTPSRLVLVADRHLLDSELVARRLRPLATVRSCRPDEIRIEMGAGPDLVLLDADAPADLFDAAVRSRPVGLLHDGLVARERSVHPGVRLLADRQTPDDLAAGVGRVLDGGSHKPAPRRPSAATPTLSPRENEVLALLARGLANRDIADELDISPHTVRTHVQALLTKLDRGNRVAVVGAARQAGLLPR